MPRPATILCVDDNWTVLIRRKMLLENAGYHVLEASTESEAVRLFVSHSVDAVILDYQMPAISGDIVAAEMKRLRAAVPIILLSAYGPLPKHKLKSVDRFLSKSQPPRVLLATLHEVLHGGTKMFFARWLDQWKGRNQGVRP
ncbi:MAG TPA: response regulator [Candidatus Nitrosotalea sp.]|nr:response regulator [Candidatus Nitrosotalea sp.]